MSSEEEQRSHEERMKRMMQRAGLKNPPATSPSKPAGSKLLPDGFVGAGKSFIERVSSVRENVNSLEMQKRLTAKISGQSAKTYAKLAKANQDLIGVSAASFFTTKAAILWQSAKDAESALREQDRAKRSGNREEAARLVAVAEAAVDRFKKALAASPPQRDNERKAKRATKRLSVPNRDGWQRAVYDAASDVQKPAIAILWATGCRPIELEKGVQIARIDGRLFVTIRGAKVNEEAGSGQPLRRLLIDEESEAGRLISELLGDQRQLVVKRAAKRLNDDLAKIRSRMGGKVSPYTFRHQFAADMKSLFGDSAEGKEAVAVAMGHQSARSQSRYGSVRQAKASGGAVVDARASKPVRSKAPTAGPPSRKRDPSGPSGPS